ncbi:MAG TPA: metallophosphoesterase, partial [Puia sp.]|nr:metallophosphoesterase [Puia sp.]
IPAGFKGFDSSRVTIKKVRSQLSILDNYKGYAYFIPGNHDWWNRPTYEKGKRKLAMEESFIEENLKKNTNIANPDNVFLPKNGNYGPEFVDLNHQTIRIIFIDTYRIIQTGIKKNKIPEEEKLFYNRLDSVIKDGYTLKEKIVVVAHHPVHVAGPYNNLLKHPYLFARIKASSPDFPSYKMMISNINSILYRYPGIYYASGHAHTLQYFFTKDSIHYIISGAGSKEKMLSEKDIKKYNQSLSPNEYLLWNSGGFFEIEFQGKASKTLLYYDNGSKKCLIHDYTNQ